MKTSKNRGTYYSPFTKETPEPAFVGTSVSLAETYFTAPFFAYIIFLRWIPILERR